MASPGSSTRKPLGHTTVPDTEIRTRSVDKGGQRDKVSKQSTSQTDGGNQDSVSGPSGVTGTKALILNMAGQGSAGRQTPKHSRRTGGPESFLTPPWHTCPS